MGKKKSYCTEKQKYKLLRILDAFEEFLDKYEYEYFYAERYGAFISNQFDPESNTFLDDYIFRMQISFMLFWKIILCFVRCVKLHWLNQMVMRNLWQRFGITLMMQYI